MATTEFKPLGMLTKFKAAIEVPSVSFINFDDEKILQPLSDLIAEFEKSHAAKKKEKERLETDIRQTRNPKKKKELKIQLKKKGLSDYLDSYEVHKAGQRLWQELMSAALRNIDRHPKGNSELFKYIDAATKFEDMLYGLEEYYRDHTLHSLWVYLIGVLLMENSGQFSHKNMYSGRSKGKSKSKANKKHCDADHLNWYLYNDIEQGKNRYPYPDILDDWAKFRKDCFHTQSQRHRDAIWCIMALCHDLGYSLAKLRGLNEKVQEVLKFFHITDFKQVGYSLDVEHQYLIEQFLELMAMDVRIVPGEDYENLDKDESNPSAERIDRKDFSAGAKHAQKEGLKRLRNCNREELDNFEFWTEFEKSAGDQCTKLAKRIEEQTLVKCYRDDSTYWRLCKALEKKEHGILSAYLLFKTLGTFADTSVRGSAEDWGLEDEEVIYNVIRGDILFAIAQHEFEYAHIDQLGSLAEILILCDELEEFTRLGRQLQSRKYHDTAAETRVEISESKGARNLGGAVVAGKWVAIKMEYVAKHDTRKEFFGFFARKCERLHQLYSLGQKHAEGETLYNPIGRVVATFCWEDPNVPESKLWKLAFEMKKDSVYATLYMCGHRCEVKDCQKKKKCPTKKVAPNRKYEMECMDDKVLIKTTCTEAITLRKWLNVPEDE